MPSNAELEKLVEELKGQVERLTSQVNKPEPKLPPAPKVEKAFRRVDRPESGGWLVKSINPSYWGTTCKVKFSGGMAIVDISRPDADRIVENLEKDYGYEVIPGTDEELIKIRKQISAAVPPAEDFVSKLS